LDTGTTTYTCGTWALRVFNPLVHPATIGDATINMYFGGAKDFEVHYPDIRNVSLQFVQGQGSLQEIRQPGDGEIATIGTGSVHLRGKEHFGEQMVSLRDWTKRYAFGSMSNQLGPGYQNFNIAQGNQFQIFGSLQSWELAETGHLGWIGSMYRFRRGGLRVKITFPFNQQQNYLTIPYKSEPRLFAAFFTAEDVGDLTSAVNASNTIFGLTAGIGMSGIQVNGAQVVAGTNPRFVYRTTNDPIYFTGTFGSGVAVAMTDQNVPYLELELPFLSQYNVAAVSDATNNGGWANIRDVFNAGSLVIGEITQDAAQSITQSNDGWGITYAVSAADDHRFGTLLGPHRIYVTATTDVSGAGTAQPTLPDQYST